MKLHLLSILLASSVCACGAVEVIVREKQRHAMLFQSVVLPCQYHTASSHAPVVQWWFKSHCRDRTRDSFLGSAAVQASHMSAESRRECSDSSRTVHIVASRQGPSLTVSEHYKGRDITIVNNADLRIGELRWGDSGVYFCHVTIADDLEGKNEDHVELLVLGRTGERDDLLPGFDVGIMPEWLFVGSVVLGSILFLLLAGICWCQCCPHTCCCYLRCCCCPDTCCCPRHLYEAGKLAKHGQPSQVCTPVYPYYIPGVPTVVPLAPSSVHVDPQAASCVPSVENTLAGVRRGYRQGRVSVNVLYYVEKAQAQVPFAKVATLQRKVVQYRHLCNLSEASSLSELSSLHEGGKTDFRQTYQTIQMKALPPIADVDDLSVLRAACTTQGRRFRRDRWDRGNHSDDELDRRWNPGFEHLQRTTLSTRGRTGSLDELEEFARSYARRDEPRRRHNDQEDHRRRGGEDDEGWRRHSPSPLPWKRRDTWDVDRPRRPARGNHVYDDAFLAGALEGKARGGGGRREEDSDTPSKGSSRGGKGSDYYSRSPSNRPEDEDPLPPYSEREAERCRRSGQNAERCRAVESPGTQRYGTTELEAMRPFSYTRPPQALAHTLQGRAEDQDRNRNMSTALSRGSLIV